MAKYSCYIVFEGRVPGIYDTWDECAFHTNHYSNSKFVGCYSKSLAKHQFRAYQKAKDGMTSRYKRIPVGRGSEVMSAPTEEFISVSANYSPLSNSLEFKGILGISGEVIFQSKDYTGGNKNIGEFLAIIEAVKWMRANYNHEYLIYSDSVAAIKWYQVKTFKSSLSSLDMDSELHDLLIDSKHVFKDDRIDGIYHHVCKWNSNKWGQITSNFFEDNTENKKSWLVSDQTTYNHRW